MQIQNTDKVSADRTRLLGLLAALLSGIAAGISIVYLNNLLPLVLAFFGLIVVLITFRRPDIGLLVLVFIVYTRFSNVLVDYHGLPSIMKFYVPLLLGVITLRWFVFREEPKGWQAAFAVMAIYGFINGISTLYAANSTLAWDEFMEFVKDAMMVIVIVILLKKGTTFRQVVWTLLLAGIFLGSLTTYQQLTGSFDNNFGGFANAEVRNIAGEVNDYRIQGPISSNYFSLILVVLVPLGVDRFLHEKAWLLRVLALWALAVCLFSILFTYSRGGLLTLGFVSAVMLVRYRPKPIMILTTAALLLPLIFFALPEPYLERLSNLGQIVSLIVPQPESENFLRENALRGRLSEMTVSALVFADYPLSGVGLGNFEEYYLDYSPALGLDPRREDRAAHILYLEIAAETGIFGLAAFGLMIFAAFRGLQWSYFRFRDLKLDDYADLTFAVGLSLFGYLAGSIFLHAAYFRYFWLVFAVTMAIPQVVKSEIKAVREGVVERHEESI